LFELSFEEFKKFYLFLSKESIFNDIPLKLKEETKFHEESITVKFYRDYKQFKDKIFENLVKNNSQYDKLTLFKKTQKLLDRFIFIWFAEDCGLVAPNLIANTIQKWKVLLQADEYFSLFSRFQKAFHYLNVGYTFQNTVFPAFNGGLFKKDEIIDNSELKIDDDILLNDSLKISAYDFNTELDVNILGHIFEHSLNELEEIAAELKGEILDKTKTKRKKDGIFYTPKYITQYIVDNSIGAICREKKILLNISDIEISELYRKNNKVTKQGKELFETLQTYKNWLFGIKILDPACGSGAFLNQALDFLIVEHNEIDELIAELTGDKVRLFDTDKTILESNIFGVDINEESVEIAKLSLWLRTAKKDRPLSDLNNNIKCGNSLIDNIEIAPEKEFNWTKQFPEIMQNGGFDIVIGNPPYVRADIDKPEYQKQRRWLETCGQYETLYEKWDLMVAFYEKSLKLLKENGIHAFIVSNSITTSKYAFKLHEFILKKYNLISIDYFDEFEVFKGVGVIPVITVIQNKKWNLKVDKITRINTFQNFTLNQLKFQNLTEVEAIKVFKKQYDKFEIKIDYELLNNICYTSVGMVINADEINCKGLFTKDDIISFVKIGNYSKPFVEGKDLKDYLIEQIKYLEWDTDRVPSKLRRKTFSELYEGEKILRGRVTGAVYDNTGIICNDGVIVFKRFCDLANVNQLSITSSITKNNNFKRNELEQISKQYYIKYLLAIINSKFAYWFLNNQRRHRLENYFYPDDFRKLPIPKINTDEQIILAEKAENIMFLKKQIQKKVDNFITIITANIKAQKEFKGIANLTISVKLRNFYDYDFSEYFSELKKLKVVISQKELTEWKEYFDISKTEINELQYQINQTDTVIDKMVYKLYELNSEEIALVEKTDGV
jgi:type I restriction-modification system DNA methylase subunit